MRATLVALYIGIAVPSFGFGLLCITDHAENVAVLMFLTAGFNTGMAALNIINHLTGKSK